MITYVFEGKENQITMLHLQKGEVCKVTGFGTSMIPILKSGQSVICIPVTDDTELSELPTT